MRPKLKTRSVSNLLYRVQCESEEDSFQTVAAFLFEDDAIRYAQRAATDTNYRYQVKFGNHVIGQYHNDWNTL
jgi:hypothetical protein